MYFLHKVNYDNCFNTYFGRTNYCLQVNSLILRYPHTSSFHIMKYNILKIVVLITGISGALCFDSCKKDTSSFQLSLLHIGSATLSLNDFTQNINIAVDEPIVASFTNEINTSSVATGITLSSNGSNIPLSYTFADNNKIVAATPATDLDGNTTYNLQISSALKNSDGESFNAASIPFTTSGGTLKIDSLISSGKNFLNSPRITDVNRNFSAVVKFNHALDSSSINASTVTVAKAGSSATLSFSFSDGGKTLRIQSTQLLTHFQKYTLTVNTNVKGKDGFTFHSNYSREFYTALDTTPKLPLLSDNDLMTEVQHQTFKYFWDFAHPVSGLAPERNTTPDMVTIGGSGFGVMSIVVGIQRNFITRQQGVDRLQTIVNFLQTADRFHGAWPHWMSGTTGHVQSFSANDNGADLVETSYMIQGLLTVRQFLDASNVQENAIKQKIDTLWREVEWDWFTHGGQNKLFWHWSPNLGWIMNMPITGYNECLITYFLAACSPTHPITAAVYNEGWAQFGAITNGNSYYGINLPLGYPYGGPLFFSHYSFLGLNPTNLSDQYANYWTQNQNHTLINRAYCIANPQNYFGYNDKCWGLTASDNQDGYSAQSPTNDLGVITPTAALSSFPYTPLYSMDALKFFYYTLGDKLWGPYGFYDSFNPTTSWTASSTLAIDQGPIIIMIENYRTQALWNLFMSAPEVNTGMALLGFTN